MSAGTDMDSRQHEENHDRPVKHGSSIPQKNFNCVDSSLILISLVCFLADTVTDIFVCVQYFRHGHIYWGLLTLTFVLAPSIIIQVFSTRWYAADGNLTWWSGILHLLLLQPLERYVQTLGVGLKARSTKRADLVEKYYYHQNDVCMLRLFEAFLESAPQLTLQLYIMVATKDATSFTGVSAIISLLALGWAMASYSHALRQAHRDDYNVNWCSLFMQTLWHLAMIAARVAAIVAFASVYKGWIFVAIGVHWWLMTIWTYLQNTDFCPSMWEERLFNIVVGIVYCFCFFSLKEGRTRWRRAAFYSIILVEDLILVGMWYPYRAKDSEDINTALLVTSVVGFVIGLLIMLGYYRWCHPASPIYCFIPDTPENNQRTLPKKPSLALTPQGDFLPRQKSCIMLSRRSLLKSSTNIKPEVEFKEAATPALLTPTFPRHLDPHRKVIDYDKTFCIEETGVFQHYSIDTSNCVKSIASKCAPSDFTGVDLSTISAVPCEGEEGGKEFNLGPVHDNDDEHKAALLESDITPPDTPFRSPLEYGCDFASVTCSTPYTDLDKPRELSIKHGQRSVKKPIFNHQLKDVQLPDVVMETGLNGLGVIPIDGGKDSPSSGKGSLHTPRSECSKYSDAVCTPSCDEHHSNCACGIIGHLSPTDKNQNANTSYYDNVMSPENKRDTCQEKSCTTARDQYKSVEYLDKETAIIRGINTL